jgi:hypothetical protein
MSPPRDWREARRFRAWELKRQGWQQRTIAAALGVTPGAVSQWLRRAADRGAARGRCPVHRCRVYVQARQRPPGRAPRIWRLSKLYLIQISTSSTHRSRWDPPAPRSNMSNAARHGWCARGSRPAPWDDAGRQISCGSRRVAREAIGGEPRGRGMPLQGTGRRVWRRLRQPCMPCRSAGLVNEGLSLRFNPGAPLADRRLSHLSERSADPATGAAPGRRVLAGSRAPRAGPDAPEPPRRCRRPAPGAGALRDEARPGMLTDVARGQIAS